MSAVTIAEAWPKPGDPFTVDDLDRMPDDGHRYELIDGMLLVSPGPGLPHQRVAFVLGTLLEQACPEQLVAPTPSGRTWSVLTPSARSGRLAW